MSEPDNIRVFFPSSFTDSSQWPSVLEVKRYSDPVAMTIRNARNRTCLLRFGNWAGAALMGLLLIIGAFHLGGAGMIVLLLLGGSLAMYVLGNATSAFKSLSDRLTPVPRKDPRKDPKSLAAFFYAQPAYEITDWAAMYSCLSPYTTTRISLQEFTAAWRASPGLREEGENRGRCQFNQIIKG